MRQRRVASGARGARGARGATRRRGRNLSQLFRRNDSRSSCAAHLNLRLFLIWPNRECTHFGALARGGQKGGSEKSLLDPSSRWPAGCLPPAFCFLLSAVCCLLSAAEFRRRNGHIIDCMQRASERLLVRLEAARSSIDFCAAPTCFWASNVLHFAPLRRRNSRTFCLSDFTLLKHQPRSGPLMHRAADSARALQN